jgi:hypothetical protein
MSEYQRYESMTRDRPHLRRPAFVKRLQDRRFTLPEA